MSRPSSVRAYRRATAMFGVTAILLGGAMIAVTLGAGGSALSVGVILGLLFVALGLVRLYILRRGSERGT